MCQWVTAQHFTIFFIHVEHFVAYTHMHTHAHEEQKKCIKGGGIAMAYTCCAINLSPYRTTSSAHVVCCVIVCGVCRWCSSVVVFHEHNNKKGTPCVFDSCTPVICVRTVIVFPLVCVKLVCTMRMMCWMMMTPQTRQRRNKTVTPQNILPHVLQPK